MLAVAHEAIHIVGVEVEVVLVHDRDGHDGEVGEEVVLLAFPLLVLVLLRGGRVVGEALLDVHVRVLVMAGVASELCAGQTGLVLGVTGTLLCKYVRVSLGGSAVGVLVVE